jgi:putative oxidoreductase
MTMQPFETHALLARSPAIFGGLDAIAVRYGDGLALVGRVLLAWLFLASAWGGLGNMAGFATYLANLNVPNPTVFAWAAVLAEFAFGLCILFGVAGRYAALVGIGYVIVATLLAHRYWEYPAAQQGNQYNHFLKNLAVIGGLLLVFVTGPGRFSLDQWMRKQGR